MLHSHRTSAVRNLFHATGVCAYVEKTIFIDTTAFDESSVDEKNGFFSFRITFATGEGDVIRIRISHSVHW